MRKPCARPGETERDPETAPCYGATCHWGQGNQPMHTRRGVTPALAEPCGVWLFLTARHSLPASQVSLSTAWRVSLSPFPADRWPPRQLAPACQAPSSPAPPTLGAAGAPYSQRMAHGCLARLQPFVFVQRHVVSRLARLSGLFSAAIGVQDSSAELSD